MIIVPMPVILAGKGATLDDVEKASKNPAKLFDGKWKAKRVYYSPILRSVVIELETKQ